MNEYFAVGKATYTLDVAFSVGWFGSPHESQRVKKPAAPLFAKTLHQKINQQQQKIMFLRTEIIDYNAVISESKVN